MTEGSIVFSNAQILKLAMTILDDFASRVNDEEWSEFFQETSDDLLYILEMGQHV